ncbi:MAG: porin family protein [Clostridium sp.]|nr:porin family protein [Bacteroides sp.]MCM1197669.1 porin family protein [Clostridium sp.]
MKKHLRIFISAALLVFTSVAASAQFGIHTAYLNSTLGTSCSSSDKVDNTNRRGLYIGFDYDINLVAGLSVQPGIYYSYIANEIDGNKDLLGNTFEIDHVEHSLFIPVHAKYSFNIVEDILKIYVFAGPTFDFGLSAFDKVEYEGRHVDGELTYNCYSGKVTAKELSSSITDTWENKGKSMQCFNVLVGGGVGLRLVKFLDIKAGYDYGLLNLASKNLRNADVSMRNTQYYVGLGVRF